MPGNIDQISTLSTPHEVTKSIYLRSLIEILNSKNREDVAIYLREILSDTDDQKRVTRVMNYMNSTLKKMNLSLFKHFESLLSEFDSEIFFPIQFSACGSLITYRDIDRVRVCTHCSKFFLAGSKKKKKDCCTECVSIERRHNVTRSSKLHQRKRFAEAKSMEEEFFRKMNFIDPTFDPAYKEKFINFSSFKAWYGMTDREARKEFRKRYLERYLNSKFKDGKERQVKRRLLKFQLKWDI